MYMYGYGYERVRVKERDKEPARWDEWVCKRRRVGSARARRERQWWRASWRADRATCSSHTPQVCPRPGRSWSTSCARSAHTRRLHQIKIQLNRIDSESESNRTTIEEDTNWGEYCIYYLLHSIKFCFVMSGAFEYSSVPSCLKELQSHDPSYTRILVLFYTHIVHTTYAQAWFLQYTSLLVNSLHVKVSQFNSFQFIAMHFNMQRIAEWKFSAV